MNADEMADALAARDTRIDELEKHVEKLNREFRDAMTRLAADLENHKRTMGVY